MSILAGLLFTNLAKHWTIHVFLDGNEEFLSVDAFGKFDFCTSYECEWTTFLPR